MPRICFRKYTKVTIVKLNLFPVWVIWERQRAFLMCPAASLPPRSVCHFVRPHKNATRSCVEEQGKGIGCLMDIPEAEASTPRHICFMARSAEFRFCWKTRSVGSRSRGRSREVGRRKNGKWVRRRRRSLSDGWEGTCTREKSKLQWIRPPDFGAGSWTICFLIVPDVLA